ncbi:MAG: redox-sensing transcriptional repressor Rex [Bacillota bacterium]|nr:redox-sensing transcriptional repressor Rex [Bacillota bacterium]
MARLKKPDPAAELNMPQPALRRLPQYFGYLVQQREQGVEIISSSRIAEDLNLHPVQVRKDMALTRVSGKPRTGFNVQALIDELARMLDYNNLKNAVVVGCGHLGSALLNYRGFQGYGLNLMAGFDSDPKLVGSRVGEVPIYPLDELDSVVREHQVQIGVITVPRDHAQHVCDLLLAAGIKAIWNFAPTHLSTPEDIIVQNENIAASLSVLSKRLSDQQLRQRSDQIAEGSSQG